MLISHFLVVGSTICLSSIFTWLTWPTMVRGQMDSDDSEEDNKDNISTTTPHDKYFYYNLSLFAPNQEFKPIEFDEQIAGGFQISGCLKDLMECWSILKAETLCHYQNLGKTLRWRNVSFWGSACDIMRDYCNDNAGDQYVPETRFWFKFTKKRLDDVKEDCPLAPEWT